ncbi:hypothetical protein HO173_010118 [Letharia columbiana]|uniref:Uncharacterized protein n=1 Tax=Letharia columbiana TaxID=112416 RepID=A0A8H6L129_9LECA|nr:uncharacterized protein HO173_010118 [Letharia columbiana]KAF6231586.1 hypothetical protein HO173_010118 [Letharia columbiana]
MTDVQSSTTKEPKPVKVICRPCNGAALEIQTISFVDHCRSQPGGLSGSTKGSWRPRRYLIHVPDLKDDPCADNHSYGWYNRSFVDLGIMDPDPTPGDRSTLFHVQIVTNEHSKGVPRVLHVYGTAFTFKVKGKNDRGMLECGDVDEAIIKDAVKGKGIKGS